MLCYNSFYWWISPIHGTVSGKDNKTRLLLAKTASFNFRAHIISIQACNFLCSVRVMTSFTGMGVLLDLTEAPVGFSVSSQRHAIAYCIIRMYPKAQKCCFNADCTFYTISALYSCATVFLVVACIGAITLYIFYAGPDECWTNKLFIGLNSSLCVVICITASLPCITKCKLFGSFIFLGC